MRLWFALAEWMCGVVFAQTPSAAPVDIQIPVSPTPFASKGQLHYVYEIHLTNFSRRGLALTLSSVEVLSDHGKQLANFGTEKLKKSLMQPGLAAVGRRKAGRPLRLGVGGRRRSAPGLVAAPVCDRRRRRRA